MIDIDLIDRLLKDAPKLEGRDDQSPAIECTVFLTGIGPVRGSLAAVADLPTQFKMMTVAKGTDGKEQFLEMFFGNDLINAIAIERQVSARPSIIVKS